MLLASWVTVIFRRLSLRTIDVKWSKTLSLLREMCMGLNNSISYWLLELPAKRPVKIRSAGTPSAAANCSIAKRDSDSKSPRLSGFVA